MKAVVAWLEKTAEKLGVSSSESKVLGCLALSLSVWDLAGMILEPFKAVASPADILTCVRCLDHLQVVGMFVCLTLLVPVVFALAHLIAKWGAELLD